MWVLYQRQGFSYIRHIFIVLSNQNNPSSRIKIFISQEIKNPLCILQLSTTNRHCKDSIARCLLKYLNGAKLFHSCGSTFIHQNRMFIPKIAANVYLHIYCRSGSKKPYFVVEENAIIIHSFALFI